MEASENRIDIVSQTSKIYFENKILKIYKMNRVKEGIQLPNNSIYFSEASNVPEAWMLQGHYSEASMLQEFN